MLNKPMEPHKKTTTFTEADVKLHFEVDCIHVYWKLNQNSRAYWRLQQYKLAHFRSVHVCDIASCGHCMYLVLLVCLFS